MKCLKIAKSKLEEAGENSTNTYHICTRRNIGTWSWRLYRNAWCFRKFLRCRTRTGSEAVSQKLKYSPPIRFWLILLKSNLCYACLPGHLTYLLPHFNTSLRFCSCPYPRVFSCLDHPHLRCCLEMRENYYLFIQVSFPSGFDFYLPKIEVFSRCVVE